MNNEWVADTPSELREKLEEVFSLGNIKSEILNLVSSEGTQSEVDPEEPQDVEGVAEPDSPPPTEDTDS